jgi:hypothetical protein
MHESAAPSRNSISAPRTGDRRGLQRLSAKYRLLVPIYGLIALGCAGAPRPDCVPDPPPGVVGSVCSFRNPEDVAAVPSARILLVSQMRHDDSEDGGSIAALSLSADGVPAGPPRTLWPPEMSERQTGAAENGAAGEARCTLPPPAKRFAPHGIAVGAPRADGSLPVAVVAHDPREAVELFELTPTGDGHRLRWSGCIPLPPGATGNDVALVPDGSLLVTNYTPRGDGPAAIYYALRSGLGLATGDVLAWTRGGGWAHVSGTAAAYPNGIARSPDDAGFYLAETGTGRIAKLALSASAAATDLGSVQIGGHPDNLAWSPRGPLLAVTHTSGSAFLLCALGRRPCRSAWSLFEIDTEKLVARERLHCDGAAVGGVASVAEVSGRFYFGAVFGDRIGVWRPSER